ncbi:FUSC family protein [Gordonia hydrophobica]|uniref:FUSC family protein n=1 Tax=Gordonia hydrophobica TaxID=40516 RepID=A0ABZ2U6Z2_9ACTN|nr:FUSC family protein [Gordonia hydrophobica]MBM7368275.1 hypothetical protein [Gordonia hydrophobica]
MSNDPLVPPARPSVSALLLGRPSVRGRWAPAMRAGLAFLIPALILLACDARSNAVLAALGSFAVLFGERRPYRIRWKTISTAGVLLILVVAVFGLLGHWVGPDASVPRELVSVAALGALAAVGVFVVNALRLGPPGPFFLVLAGGVAVLVGRAGLSVGLLVIYTAAGAVASLVVSIAPALWRPRGPETAITEAALAEIEQFLADNREPSRRHGVAASTLTAWSVLHDASQTDSELAHRLWRSHNQVHDAASDEFIAPLPRPGIGYRLRSAARLDSHPAVTAMRATIAALLAGGISVVAGLGRPDWAILGAVLVLQMGPDRVRGAVRGAQRVVGTFIGLAIFAVLHALDLHTVALIIVLAVLNVMIELTVTTNYALAVTFITPLALLMGAPDRPLLEQMGSRAAETVLGVGLAVAMASLMFARIHRRTLRAADDAARTACVEVLQTAADQVPSTPTMRARRRDLQWQLLESELAATDSANDEPAWARDYWPRHAAVRAVGYDTLSACWRAGPDTLVRGEALAELSSRVSATDG